MKRKLIGKITDESELPSENYEEQKLRPKEKKKRVVSKYKPSRHSR